MPDPGHNFGRGKTGWVTLDDDPEVMLGVEPRRFIDHTTLPWPTAFRQMVDWRAGRAGAPIHLAGLTIDPCDTDSDKLPPAANEGDPRR